MYIQDFVHGSVVKKQDYMHYAMSFQISTRIIKYYSVISQTTHVTLYGNDKPKNFTLNNLRLYDLNEWNRATNTQHNLLLYMM